MKFVYAIYFFGCSACIFSTIRAAPSQEVREKRALAVELCPENSTPQECIAYAEKKSKELNFCHTFETGSDIIHWQGCGKVYCGENTRVVQEDLSRSYPDCCDHCEIIDDNKEAFISGVL